MNKSKNLTIFLQKQKTFRFEEHEKKKTSEKTHTKTTNKMEMKN